jgi:hypothetical protein
MHRTKDIKIITVFTFTEIYHSESGYDRTVGIATHYRLDDSGIESW